MPAATRSATKPKTQKKPAATLKPKNKPATIRQTIQKKPATASKDNMLMTERFILTKRNCDLMVFELYSVSGGRGDFEITQKAANELSPFPKPPGRGMYPMLELQVRNHKEMGFTQGTIKGGRFVRWISAAQAGVIKRK